MKQNYSVTVRMGAAHWDITLADGTRLNYRTMPREQRNRLYGMFMASVRKLLRRRKGGAR